MMDTNYEELFVRIREKCRRQGWYGPSIYEGDFEQTQGVSYWYDRNGKQYALNKNTDLAQIPVHKGFEYPSATEEQLVATENEFGFPLPSLLRALYANVANGGFGPCHGIFGAIGGYGDIKTNYLGCLRMEKEPDSIRYIRVTEYIKPDRFLVLCDRGCARGSFLDCINDRVYSGTFGLNNYDLNPEEYEPLEASSLYEWLDLWTKDIETFTW